MSGGLGLLSDNAAFEDNFITKIDPRIKFIYTIIFLFIIISTKNIFVPAAVLVVMNAGLLSMRINRKIFLIRGLPALIIAVTILVTQIFLYGKTPLFTINIFNFQIRGYHEGLVKGTMLMFRVLSGISMVLLLTMSTTISKLLFAAKWFHIPNAFLEVFTITYRYIFVLFEEITTVKNAQKTRLGFSNYSRTIKSFGNLSGIVILRTIDKSEKLYKSMKSRGYNGQQISVQYNAKFLKSDWAVAAIMTVIFFVVLILSL